MRLNDTVIQISIVEWFYTINVILCDTLAGWFTSNLDWQIKTSYYMNNILYLRHWVRKELHQDGRICKSSGEPAGQYFKPSYDTFLSCVFIKRTMRKPTHFRSKAIKNSSLNKQLLSKLLICLFNPALFVSGAHAVPGYLHICLQERHRIQPADHANGSCSPG